MTGRPVAALAGGAALGVVAVVVARLSGVDLPWLVAATVPAAIYTIPPSAPLYYVRHVYVYGATPEDFAAVKVKNALSDMLDQMQ